MGLHSTEVGASQMAAELVWDLLARNDGETQRIELILRRARNFVNPSELFGLLAGAAEDPKNLAVDR